VNVLGKLLKLEPGLSSEEIRPEAPTLFDELDADKDGVTAASTSAEQESQQEGTPAPAEPGELLRQGMDFLSGLAQTLSDPEATRRLVDSVVQKDKEDGRTYLKIPVESSKTVEYILGMIGSLVDS